MARGGGIPPPGSEESTMDNGQSEEVPSATPSRRFRTTVFRVLRVLVVAWALMSVLAALFYPHLLYHPDRNKSTLTPATLGVPYEEFWLTAADGARLHGWFVPADPAVAKSGTLLVFHGNAGNLATAAHRLALYSGLGRDVFMIDYHGFGESGGKPSEANLYLGAETVWEHLTVTRGVPPGEIVIMGYSLGGAVASWLAERNPGIAGLVLESTFTRLSDVASDFFPYLPCRLILGGAYNTLGRLPRIKAPLLVVHGKGDALVAFKYGEKIYAEYHGDKSFLLIGNDHNVGFLVERDRYMHGLGHFFEKVAKGAISEH